MNSYIKIAYTMSIVVAILASCQQQKKEQATSTSSNDTVAVTSMKPIDTGYAKVNGLKMYYEVYGDGKPIVLLHGSYMNIPLNWSNMIPLLATRSESDCNRITRTWAYKGYRA